MSTVGRRAALTPRHLTRTSERLSFIYLERCTVHRDANAITAEDADGTTHIPPPPSAPSSWAPAHASPTRR